MEQDHGNSIRFREVDQDGRPVDEAFGHEGHGEPGQRVWTSINPFIVVLWVLAAVLVTGGVWVSFSAASMLGPSAGVQPLAYILMNLAPWAVLAGLLDGLALLFWHANGWQRKWNGKWHGEPSVQPPPAGL